MIYAPDAERHHRVVFLRGLELQARLGIYPHEKAAPQRIVLSIELVVEDDAAPHAVGPDTMRRVVDYESLVLTARATVAEGHVLLVETLGERVALAALADPRVLRARVTVEKPDAFPDVASVGVVVERIRDAHLRAPA